MSVVYLFHHNITVAHPSSSAVVYNDQFIYQQIKARPDPAKHQQQTGLVDSNCPLRTDQKLYPRLKEEAVS